MLLASKGAGNTPPPVTTWRENDMNVTDAAYKKMLETPLDHYHDMVGWEQEWEAGGRAYDGALFKAIEAHGRVLETCGIIAKAFSMTVDDVYSDVEEAYTGC